MKNLSAERDGPPDPPVGHGGCQVEAKAVSCRQDPRSQGATEAPQAPVVRARSRRILGALHFTGPFWYRLIAWGSRHLPEVLKRAAVLVFTTLFTVALGQVRRAVIRNLRVAIGRNRLPLLGGFWRAFRLMLNHGWCMTESWEGLGGLRPREVEVEGSEHWQRLAEKKGGWVIVTAHVGHWEIGSHFAERDRTIHVVREPEIDPEAQQFLRQQIEQESTDSYRVHFADGSDLSIGMRLLAALRRGELVALQGDRPRTGSRSVEAEFLGRPLSFPAGPVVLARLAGVPLVPIFVVREGRRRSRVLIREPIVLDDSLSKSEAEEQAVRAIAAEVEKAVRRAPLQWFCFRDLWPD